LRIQFPNNHKVSKSSGGEFVVVWDIAEAIYSINPVTTRPQDAPAHGILGQRYTKAAKARGPAFQIADDTLGEFATAADRSGNFVVVWTSNTDDGSGTSIRGQRFDSSAARVGPEFQVNTYTAGNQEQPSVAIDQAGNFLVAWASVDQDGSSLGVFGARFARDGTRLGNEFPISAYTTGAQSFPRVVNDGRGFVFAWESDDQDGAGHGVFGRRQNPRGDRLAVDPAPASGTSDGNGVLEPGETAVVVPHWRNDGDTPIAVTGSSPVSSCGPGIACLTDGSADYGSIAAGTASGCDDGGTDACYRVSVTGPRPQMHWDGGFSESLSSGGGQLWTLHIGDSFSDVPRSHPFYKRIEALLHYGIAAGCTATEYCPELVVDRSEMAIALANGLAGLPELVPSTGVVFSATGPASGDAYNCSAGGNSLFADISPTDSFCKHAHYLAAYNVTFGCGGANYCPGQTVTRNAMAAFLARAIAVALGAGNSVPLAYGPDPVTGRLYSCNAGSPTIHFTDVPTSNAFCKAIHYLWAREIADGCSATQYCATAPLSRDAMAKFITRGFGLEL
jgi:hypothetical protein